MSKNQISAVRRVASNVPEGPDSLLSDIVTGRAEQLYKDWNCSVIDNDLRVVRRPGSNIGERPCCFKLRAERCLVQIRAIRDCTYSTGRKLDLTPK